MLENQKEESNDFLFEKALNTSEGLISKPNHFDKEVKI